MVSKPTANGGPAKAGASVRFNGHPQRVSGITLEDNKGTPQACIVFSDVQTKHRQALTIPWSACRSLITDEKRITGTLVLLNGHEHRVVGVESKKKDGVDWLQFGLKDESTGHMSALEVDKKLLAWRKQVAAFVGIIENALNIGGSVLGRFQRAIDAFLREEK